MDLSRSRVVFGVLTFFAVGYVVNLALDASVPRWTWALAAVGFTVGCGVLLGSLLLRLKTKHRGPLASLMTANNPRYSSWVAVGAIASAPLIGALLAAEWQVVLNAVMAGGVVAFLVVPPGRAAELR
jgi:hypothetical protein